MSTEKQHSYLQLRLYTLFAVGICVCVSILSQKLQLPSLMAHQLLKLMLLPMQSTAICLH